MIYKENINGLSKRQKKMFENDEKKVIKIRSKSIPNYRTYSVAKATNRDTHALDVSVCVFCSIFWLNRVVVAKTRAHTHDGR